MIYYDILSSPTHEMWVIQDLNKKHTFSQLLAYFLNFAYFLSFHHAFLFLNVLIGI